MHAFLVSASFMSMIIAPCVVSLWAKTSTDEEFEA